MSKRRPYIGPSDAQSNADALARRSAPYSAAADASVRIAWDWRKRQPKDLREAVRMTRALYADEVPTKLHEAAIGEGGTPRMTARAEGYIFGSGTSDDAPRGKCTCQFDIHRRTTEAAFGAEPTLQHDGDCPANPTNQDMVGYFHSPFRARLAEMGQGDEQSRKRAAIVSHVTIGSMDAVPAAEKEGVPSWCAREVAQSALFAFLHSMSDIRLHLPRQEQEVGVTAA